MKMKAFIPAVIIAIFAALLSSLLTVGGIKLINGDEKEHKEVKIEESGWKNMLPRIFKSEKEKVVQFVEIKNMVVTLKSEGPVERYLLLELAITTSDPKETKYIEELVPALRGATVNLFSNMDYNQVRAMNFTVLHDRLKTAFLERLTTLGSSATFNDVIISKMIFQ